MACRIRLAADDCHKTSTTFCLKPMPTTHSISTSADADVCSPMSGSDEDVEAEHSFLTCFQQAQAVKTTTGHFDAPRHADTFRWHLAKSGEPLFQGQILWRNTFVHFPSSSLEDCCRASSCPPVATTSMGSSTRIMTSAMSARPFVKQAPVLLIESAMSSEDATPIAVQPELGSHEMPTVGSRGHWFGTCRPCAFMSRGCSGGVACSFCHLCDPSEKKRRRKEKKTFLRGLRRWRHDGTAFGNDDAWEREDRGRRQR